MRPPNVDLGIAILSLLYTLLLTIVGIYATTTLCARKRAATKRVPVNERTAKSFERKSDQERRERRERREPKESTARSDVWDEYDKKVEKASKAVESKKTLSDEEKGSKQPSGGSKTAKKVEQKPKQPTAPLAETPFDYSEALKKPPPDVDFNDFVVRAAMAQTVVNPFLVKKVGNIDDEHADPKKLKAHLQQLDEQLKSKEDSAEEIKKDAPKLPPKKVKWGDAKCVLYETRDQLTLEDDAEDAGET